jgi:hypothetical protein
MVGGSSPVAKLALSINDGNGNVLAPAVYVRAERLDTLGKSACPGRMK